MQNLTVLLQKQTETRLAVTKFLYTAGTNVALYNATRDQKYRRFEDNLEIAINKQIQPFTASEVIDEIGFETTPTLEIVDKYYPSLNTVFKGDKKALEAFFLWAGTQGGQAALDKLGIGKVRKAIEASFVMRNQ